MNYTPLLDMPGWAELEMIRFMGPIIAVPLWITLMGLCFACSDIDLQITKKRPFFVMLVIFFVTSAFAIGSIMIGNSVSEKLDARYEQNVQIMKENLTTKYDMKVESLISNEALNQPKGSDTYFFEAKDEAFIGSFSVKFEESGEPFINVENDFTKEVVEDLMR